MAPVPLEPGVGVGRVARHPFVGDAHAGDLFRLVHYAEERPRVVARHGEDVLGAELLEAKDQVFRDGDRWFGHI